MIGLAVSKQLISDGHEVVGLARSANKGMALLPSAEWLEADISKLRMSTDWLPFLNDIDVVVNASGALQSGLKDNVLDVQMTAINALIESCETAGVNTFVQISAPGASEFANTQFYRSKGAADATLKASDLHWTILRPGLVISPHTYGGTSLIRTLAAFPFVQPIVMADSSVQIVSIEDVSEAVSIAVKGDLHGQDIDIVEPQSRTLKELVLAVRAWLGFKKPKAVLSMPTWVGYVVASFADVAGWLGWRSALRSTAFKVLTSGVTGEAKHGEAVLSRPTRTLEQTLITIPSTLQERTYARAMLAFPIVLVALAVFWITSGVIGFVKHEAALAVLGDSLPRPLASAFVDLGSGIDIIIGAALLFRPTARLACFSSIIVSVGYLLGATMFVPNLWADPLGPLVKVIPALGLALLLAALLEER